MPYYVRVFCTGDALLSLAEISNWAKVNRKPFAILTLPSSSAWTRTEVSHVDNGVPFRVEVTGMHPNSECLLHDEIEELRELVANAPDSPAKSHVLDHLGRTRFVIANEIPTSRFRDRDYEALRRIL